MTNKRLNIFYMCVQIHTFENTYMWMPQTRGFCIWWWRNWKKHVKTTPNCTNIPNDLIEPNEAVHLVCKDVAPIQVHLVYLTVWCLSFLHWKDWSHMDQHFYQMPVFQLGHFQQIYHKDRPSVLKEIERMDKNSDSKA